LGKKELLDALTKLKNLGSTDNLDQLFIADEDIKTLKRMIEQDESRRSAETDKNFESNHSIYKNSKNFPKEKYSEYYNISQGYNEEENSDIDQDTSKREIRHHQKKNSQAENFNSKQSHKGSIGLRGIFTEIQNKQNSIFESREDEESSMRIPSQEITRRSYDTGDEEGMDVKKSVDFVLNCSDE